MRSTNTEATCPICHAEGSQHYSIVDNIDYLSCPACDTLFADKEFLAQVENGAINNYNGEYWRVELQSARERSYGSSLQRVAETFFYCQRPIKKFVDIGSGPGYLLDSLALLLPDASDIFHGFELFPPDAEFRSRHPNYHTTLLSANTGDKFDAGVCIEVIEHLTPAILSRMLRELAEASNPGALYLFNSGQPAYVRQEDPGYLDPLLRGHIIAYGIKGLTPLFEEAGFNLIPLPGRDWAFLAEFGPVRSSEKCTDALFSRIWSPLPENMAILKSPTFGPLMYHMGLDSARCYLEHATMLERTRWARSLNEARNRLPKLEIMPQQSHQGGRAFQRFTSLFTRKT